MAWVLIRQQEAGIYLLKACGLHRKALGAAHSEPESPGPVLAAYPNPAATLSAKQQKYIQHQQKHGWGQDKRGMCTLTTAFW